MIEDEPPKFSIGHKKESTVGSKRLPSKTQLFVDNGDSLLVRQISSGLCAAITQVANANCDIF